MGDMIAEHGSGSLRRARFGIQWRQHMFSHSLMMRLARILKTLITGTGLILMATLVHKHKLVEQRGSGMANWPVSKLCDEWSLPYSVNSKTKRLLLRTPHCGLPTGQRVLHTLRVHRESRLLRC